MFGILLKKQFTEVFRAYFYNQKTNRMRSKGSIIMMFILYAVIMFGFLGAMFTMLAVSLCYTLVSSGMGWLYFTLFGMIAITFGTFGDAFSTYSGLYLPKDNDLLLSLPIPVRTIVAARITNVYLMGTLYSGIALVPALAVHWITAGITAANLICGILFFLIVTFTVLILSALLGWLIARISLKLKNKSFITVIISIAFIALYYFVYFRARVLIGMLISNISAIGENIRNHAYVIWKFGCIGEGDIIAALIFTAAVALILFGVIHLISAKFLKLASGSSSVERVKYREKRIKKKSQFGALFGKEMKRFTSNPNYMLNCGLGLLFLPVAGILILIKGSDITSALGQFSAIVPVIVCGGLMLMSTMTDMAAPSVSLEGKSIWILQSLPVEAKTVLRAKASVQMVLTGIPMIFASVCAAAVTGSSVTEKIMIVVTPLVFTVFIALFGLFAGTAKPMLNWTTEIYPIKQSFAVFIALFGGWGIAILFAVPYLFLGSFVRADLYLAVWCVIYAVLSVILLRWIDTKGAEKFSHLQVI